MNGVAWASILSTVADSGALERAQAALDAAWVANDEVPAVIRMQMSIAVGEIVANVVEHGTQGRINVAIQLQMSVERGRVLVAIIDDGNETLADMSNVAGMPDDLAERGRGLPMAQSVLDGLSYERLSGANLWLLSSKCFSGGVDLY